jgi:hypothetical protein
MPQYHEGQVWTFNAAPLPESRVIIGKVENIQGSGWVVSVCFTNVYIEDQAGNYRLSNIAHAPMSSEALESSVIEQTGTSEPVDGFDEARREWRELLATGEAGIFAVGAGEVVRLISDAIAKGQPV